MHSHPEVTAALADTLLGSGPQTALVLEVVDTLPDGFTVGGTLGGRLLAVTAADTDTVDEVALLGLVAETVGLVGARRTGSTVDDSELTVLPAPHTGQEQEDTGRHRQQPKPCASSSRIHSLGALLVVQFSQVLVGTHFSYPRPVDAIRYGDLDRRQAREQEIVSGRSEYVHRL